MKRNELERVARRILIPLDGSELAEAVLTQVRGILKRSDSEVILAQVIQFPPISDVGGSAVMIESTQRDAEAYLEKMADSLKSQGVNARAVLRLGSVADTLLEIARDEGASLIAMSTHGRTGLSRWVFGSIAEKVLRASQVPVLAVHSFGKKKGTPVKAADLEVKKILVPIDGSEASLKIVQPAIDLANLFKARVIVLRVKEVFANYPVGAYVGEYVAPIQALPEPTVDGGADLKIAGAKFAAAEIPTVTFQEIGDPASTILDFARKESIDLIAMATHGRSGMSRWVFGSVTEKVLRASEVPMLIVRTGP